MVTASEVIDAIIRGIDDSGRLPEGTSYLDREADPQGVDSAVGLPAVVVSEVMTIRDDTRNVDIVGYETDVNGRQIGRIWQASYEMDVQIDLYTTAGASEPNTIETLEPRLRRALQRYDSQLRADFFPNEAGTGEVGAIRQFTLTDSRPQNDLSATPSLMRQRLSARVGFVDRLNEVEEYGPIPTIEAVITPRSGDFVGNISEDYELEFHPPIEG